MPQEVGHSDDFRWETEHYLRIAGFKQPHNEISRRLGRKPTIAYNKGDVIPHRTTDRLPPYRRAKTSCWFLYTKNLITDTHSHNEGADNGELIELVRFVEEKCETILSLAGSNVSITTSLIADSRSMNYKVPPEVVQILARIGIKYSVSMLLCEDRIATDLGLHDQS